MVEVSFLLAELGFALLWVLCRALVWVKQGRIVWKRELVLLMLYAKLAVVLRFAFYPFHLDNGVRETLVIGWDNVRHAWVNLTPLVRLREYEVKREAVLNLLGNIALFIPAGIILPIVFKRLDSFWKVTLAGFGISLALELLQLLTPRCTDVDDLLLNTLGTAIGYGIYTLFRRALSPEAEKAPKEA